MPPQLIKSSNSTLSAVLKLVRHLHDRTTDQFSLDERIAKEATPAVPGTH